MAHSWIVSGVRALLGAHPKMKAVIYACLYIFAACVQLTPLPLCIRLLTHFQIQVDALLPPGVSRRNIQFGWFYTGTKDLERPVFVSSFLFTAVVHPWPTDLQPVLTGRSRKFYVCFFKLFFLLSPFTVISLSFSI